MFRITRQYLLRWACTLLFAFTAIAVAEPVTLLRGIVADPSGAVVANARVELLEHGVSVAHAVTDGRGQYSIPRKLETVSHLRVTAVGFKALEKALDTTAGTRELTVNIVLQLTSLSEQITVTATGSPTPLSQLGATVTVLDSSDYQGTRDIQQGLQLIPGVQTTQSGQAGGTTGLYIRGGSSDANKVLIDGIPMNDIGGNVEFANAASAAIERVEVLRGPNSALYGSDALAGVVSLTTARGITPLPLFIYQVGGGNFGTYRQEGTVSGKYQKFDYLSDYSRFDSNNSIADSKYHNGTFTGNYGWELSPSSSLRATLHHDQVASGQSGAIQLYGVPTEAEQSNEDAYFGVTWEDQTNTNWHNLLRYGGQRLRSQYIQFAPSGTSESGYTLGAPVTISGANGYTVGGQAPVSNYGPFPDSSPSSTDKDFVYAQSGYHFNPHLLGLVGFRYEDERGFSYGSSPIERGNYSYTFQLQGDIRGRLFYTVGSGLEDDGLFGVAGTPRASIAWQAAQGGAGSFFSGTKLRASFGKGIKEPDVYDQLNSLATQLEKARVILPYQIVPIGPQTSRTYEGGIDQALFGGRSRISLTLFHNEFTNGIEYLNQQGLIALGLPSSITGLFSAYNEATVNSLAYRAQGAEADVDSRITRNIFVRSGYTYLDARVQNSFSSDIIGPGYYNPNFSSIQIGAESPLIGARPFRRAPHTGYFEAIYRRNRFSTGLRGTFVGRRDDSDFLVNYNNPNNDQTLLLPNRNLDGAYQRLDLTSSYQANPHVAIDVNIQNLLSEHYSEAFGYPALPLMFRMGMKFTFGGESWSVR
jgi:iron complex outermembrane receptor protein/vitamin B12 transporter